MSLNQKRGNYGERLAAAHLEQKGFAILEKNYRYKRAEIDIIAQKGNLLLFVEVKARTHNDYGFPEEAVDDRKAAMIMMAADQYIHEKQWQFDIRFDIISISLRENGAVHHFEDVFF